MLFKTPNLQSVGGPFIKLSTPKRMLYVFNIFCHLYKKLYIYKRNSFSFCLFFSSSFLPKVIHFRVKILFYARSTQCWFFPLLENRKFILIIYLLVLTLCGLKIGPIIIIVQPLSSKIILLMSFHTCQLDQKKGFFKNKYNRSKRKSLGDKNEYCLRPYRIFIVL